MLKVDRLLISTSRANSSAVPIFTLQCQQTALVLENASEQSLESGELVEYTTRHPVNQDQLSNHLHINRIAPAPELSVLASREKRARNPDSRVDFNRTT